MDELLRVAPRAGSYVAESDFFESFVATVLLGLELPEVGRRETAV